MKRFFAFFYFCSLTLGACAQAYLTLDEAKQIAETYYDAFRQMASNPIGDEAVSAKLSVFPLIGVDNFGRDLAHDFRVPNDLGKIFGTSLVNDCRIGNYIEDFRMLAEKNSFTFSYKLVSNEYLKGPQMKGSESFPDFVRVVVRKDFKLKGRQPLSFNDTLFLSTRLKSFSSVVNQYRRKGEEDEKYMTIEELLAEAQNCYSNKRYDKAYELYLKVLERSPMNEVASYNLGVMSFKGEGCKKYPRKVRDYLVGFYWQKSEKGLEQLSINLNELNVKMRPFSGRESNPFPSNRLFAYNYKTKKLGYISAQGKMVIKQQYQYGYPFFTNGTAIVRSDKNEWFLIDTMGKVKDVYAFCYTGDSHPLFGMHGKYLFVENNNGKKGLINRITGQWWLPCAYDVKQYVFFDGDLAYCIVNKGEKSGVCAEGGKVILPFGTYKSIYVVCRTAEKVRILCDYDEKELKSLLEKYRKGSLIPYEDMDRIGTLFTININQ